jgi:hypothetical protein
MPKASKNCFCKFLGKLVNFMRILKGLLCLGFLGETRMGGENQRASLIDFWVILYAPFIGNPSYLEPIWILIVVLCRKRGGGSISTKNEGVGSVLAQKTPNSMQKTGQLKTTENRHQHTKKQKTRVVGLWGLEII